MPSAIVDEAREERLLAAAYGAYVVFAWQRVSAPARITASLQARRIALKGGLKVVAG